MVRPIDGVQATAPDLVVLGDVRGQIQLPRDCGYSWPSGLRGTITVNAAWRSTSLVWSLFVASCTYNLKTEMIINDLTKAVMRGG